MVLLSNKIPIFVDYQRCNTLLQMTVDNCSSYHLLTGYPDFFLPFLMHWYAGEQDNSTLQFKGTQPPAILETSNKLNWSGRKEKAIF